MRNVLKRLRLPIAVGFLAAVAVAGFGAWSQTSNKGEISQPGTSTSKIAQDGIAQFNGKFITFTYSTQYMVSQKEPSGGDLEIYQFDAAKPYPKKISVSVSDLPDGTLNSNSAYLLRTSHTDKFYQRNLSVNIPNAEVWSSTDGTKQTVFITRNGRAAVLAFTQDGGDKTLYNNEVDAIVGSFEWK